MDFPALHERPGLLLLISGVSVTCAALLMGVQTFAAPEEYPISIEVRDSVPLKEEFEDYRASIRGGTEFSPSDFEEREPVDWHQYAIDEERERQQLAGEEAIEDEYRRGIFPGDCSLVSDLWWREKCISANQTPVVTSRQVPEYSNDSDWIPDRTPQPRRTDRFNSSPPASFGLLGGRTGRCTGFLRQPDPQKHFCGDEEGWTFPVLFGGDCPITLCMVKYGGGDGVSGLRQ